MPGRLYLKIFLSFMIVIVVAMILVAGLFRHTAVEKFMSEFDRFAQAQIMLVRMMTETRIKTHPNSPEKLQELADTLGQAYLAKIWITDNSGEILAKSFAGAPPSLDDLESEDDWEHDDHDLIGAEVFHCDKRSKCLYVTIPYGGIQDVPPGIIHYYFTDAGSHKKEKFFLLGLVGICVSVALLVMPVSWFITRRLNKLRGVALRIADGDLSHRADVCGKDEVAKVGRALNRMADSLQRMIRGSKELTANVSHELRTPLTRIRIAEEILRQRCGEAGVAHLDSIREDVDALDKLIGKLLDLSKLDLKEDPFTIEELDLTELAEAITARLEPIARHRSLAMTVNMPDEALIQADGEALNTALGNIFENGVKHATDRGWIRIGMTKTETAVTVTMENSHDSLPEDELAAIFEPFRRAKGTTADGTGLGLAIAKKIVERHGGEVTAENCDGGIRFTVRLPRQAG